MNIEMNVELKQKLEDMNDRIAAYEAAIRDLINERNKIIFEQRRENSHE
jgi:hypothetical protein